MTKPMLKSWLAIVLSGVLGGVAISLATTNVGPLSTAMVVRCLMASLLLVAVAMLLWKTLVAQLRRERRTQHRLQSKELDVLSSDLERVLNAICEVEVQVINVSSSVAATREKIENLDQTVRARDKELSVTSLRLREIEALIKEFESKNERLQALVVQNIRGMQVSQEMAVMSSERVERAIFENNKDAKEELTKKLSSTEKKLLASHDKSVQSISRQVRKDTSLPQILERLMAMERRMLAFMSEAYSDESDRMYVRVSRQIDALKTSAELLCASSLSEVENNFASVNEDLSNKLDALQSGNNKVYKRLTEENVRQEKAHDDLYGRFQELEIAFKCFSEATREDIDKAAKATGKHLEERIDDSVVKSQSQINAAVVKLSDRTERSIKRHTIDGVRQNEAFAHLQSMAPNTDRPLPPLGGWALTADTMLYVYEWILENRPKRILEVGSGSSSVWMGVLAREIGAQIVSLEHSQEFGETTAGMLEDFDLTDTVDLRIAELNPIELNGRTYMWYDVDSFADIGDSFELLIVDGPPESTGEYARFPALPVLEKRLAKSCTVLLDDVHRPNETQILQNWQHDFPLFVERHSGLTRTGVISRPHKR